MDWLLYALVWNFRNRENDETHYRERPNLNSNREPRNRKSSKDLISNRGALLNNPDCPGIFMITYNNLFSKLCSLENLRLAFRKARKGKTKKWYVKEFEANLKNELIKLKIELEIHTYKPKPLKRFVIRDPKTRVIHASAFRDRVVHHAICNLIEPLFEKAFIHDSYASRKKKGAHAALERFDEFKRKVSENGRLVKNAKDENMIVGYVLKADIKHYFDTVDHNILLKIIRKKIADEDVLNLIKIILESHETKVKGKGMPLGNLTSQFFANVYLNELDYFIKHELKSKYYIRYVDDFVILHRTKNKLLLYAWLINNFLRQRLKLELHPEKSKVVPLHKGINLLGFRVFYHYKIPRKSNMKKFERKLGGIIFGPGKNDACDKINRMLEGWFGYVIHSNTYMLRKRMVKKISCRLNYSGTTAQIHKA